MSAAVLAPGFVIGTALGLLGGGGSVLTVPIFVYLLGFDPKEAIAMSLIVVGVTSAVGTVGHSHAGRLNLRAGLLFGGAATVGTLAGSRAGVLVPGDVQMVLFGAVMLTAAAFMVRGANASHPVDSGARVREHILLPIVASALAVGFLTGLLGVGGGFLIVPALLLIHLPLDQAVGTSLLVIAINCGVGLCGYVGHVHIAWPAVALVIAGTLPGIAVGTYLHRLVPVRLLRGSFAGVLVVTATFILYRYFAHIG